MSVTVVDELVTLLGFDIKSGTGAMIAKFGQSIENIAAKAKVAAAALVATSAAVGYFVEKSNSATSELYKLKDLTGLSAKALQDWGFAAEQAGGSAHDIQRDLIGLEKALHPTMPGEYNEGLFQLLGPTYLQKYKNVKDVLFAVADAIKTMPKGLALNYLAMAGISESSYHLLSKGKAGVDQILGKGMPFALSDAQVEKAFKFDQAMKQVYTIIKNVGAAISSDLAPYLTKVLIQFEKWLVFNKQIIESKLSDFISGVGAGFKRFSVLIQDVWGFISKLIPQLQELTQNLSVKELAEEASYAGLVVLGAALVLIYGKAALVAGAILGLVEAVHTFNTATAGDGSISGWLKQLGQDLTDFYNTSGAIIDKIMALFDRFALKKSEAEREVIAKQEAMLKHKGEHPEEESNSILDWLDAKSPLKRMIESLHQVDNSRVLNPVYPAGGSGNTINTNTSTSNAATTNATTNAPTYNVNVHVANPDHAGRAVKALIPQYGLQAPNP